MTRPCPGSHERAHPRSAPRLVAVVALACTLALAGCSRDVADQASARADGPAPAQGQDSQDTASLAGSPAEVRTQAAIGRIVGRMPGTRRKQLRREVTDLVDRWWEAAYLVPDSASVDLGAAFPGFTRAAARRARADRELTTSASLGAESITPLMRKVRLDVLAVGRRPRSVTARFELRVRTTGERAGRLQTRGRLFLTRGPKGWRVFGYDVSKGWL